ncbi:PQQ-like beta-propeller repeat protein [Kitasatospora sp. DSM 101779]|uniref:PQQ-like beta-propeller repeat protein n=1 Tax=Kitasatospora sp. DSM 101779 TaxID=2853165 RepID=UPI0021D9A5B8|nr:PQQ-like beta-propeller repeat protein [Kitasatospora sp. DSM 101779]MCU7822256.1 PQQ-like beta-propeller repeat protein [Kitasatospora sp. DSM 101779]
MAQDPPRTYDQGYPHDGTGQQPTAGQDYQQQGWYQPQPDQPADPWAAAQQQQPYQAGPDQQTWQQGADQQAWQQQTAAWDPTQTAQAYQQQAYDPQAYQQQAYQQQGYQQQTGQQQGYDQQGYYAGGYEQIPQQTGDPHQANAAYTDPYAAYGASSTGTADPYAQITTESSPYAPADPAYDGWQTQQPEMPTVGFPDTGGQGTATPAEDPEATSAATLSPYVVTRDDKYRDDYRDDADGGDAGGRRSITDRARAAATAVVSADHGPGRRTLLIRAGAGAAALAVLVTAAVLVTGGDDGDKSGGGEDSAAARTYTVAHAKAWAAKPTAGSAASADDTLAGSWVTADAVVRADGNGVQAYALADGKPTWSVTAPSQGAAPCGLSPSVNTAGLGGVLFRTGSDPKSPCTVLAAVDTKTGKTAWTKNLSDTKDGYDAKVSVLDDKVVAVGEDKAFAWAAADGKDLWQYTGQGKFCSLSGGASGATVVLHSSCADSTPTDQAVALNAADGKVKWWRGLNNKPKTVTVLSAEPAVVATTGEKPTDDRIFAWGTSGDPAAEIPVTGDAGRLDVGRGTFDTAPTVFFHQNTMVAALGPADGVGAATSVTAYDLATGKPTWTTAIAEKRKSRAVGLDGGGLLLAVDERLDQPAHISRFALAGGQETQGGAFPQGIGSLLTAGRVLSADGKVVVLPEHSANYGTATAFQAKG